MPKISIIMPSLNVKKYITQCIESVLVQTLEDYEVICIDAGSTDGTKEMIEQYASKDNRIKLIKSEVKSYGYQVNMGIELAKGDYIAILETDDYIDGDMYRRLYEAAQQDKLDYAKADFDIIYEYNSKHINRKAFVEKDFIFGRE